VKFRSAASLRGADRRERGMLVNNHHDRPVIQLTGSDGAAKTWGASRGEEASRRTAP
jgi:hypothetical protein